MFGLGNLVENSYILKIDNINGEKRWTLFWIIIKNIRLMDKKRVGGYPISEAQWSDMGQIPERSEEHTSELQSQR